MSSSKAKKERRKARHERNKAKDIETKICSWNRGKLIEENHNNKYYSPEFSLIMANRIAENIKPYTEDKNSFFFYKKKAIKLILLYNPDIEKNKNYYYIKKILEDYWDGNI